MADEGFTIKEMLIRIEDKVDAMSARLDSKADTARLDNLANQFSDMSMNGSKLAKDAMAISHDLEARVRVLENTQASGTAVQQALSRSRTAMWSALVSAVAMLGGLLYLYQATRH